MPCWCCILRMLHPWSTASLGHRIPGVPHPWGAASLGYHIPGVLHPTPISPRSAMQHCRLLFTKMFLLFRSRWAMAGLPWVPKISTWRWTRPQMMEEANPRQVSTSRAVLCR